MNTTERVLSTFSIFYNNTKECDNIKETKKAVQYDRVIRDEIDKANQTWSENVERKNSYGNEMLNPSHIWLRDCKKEVIDPIPGKTTGRIPEWVTGSLLRNGPGELTIGESTFQHIFDGSAFLHKFFIQNGQVTYQNKFIKTNTYLKNHAAQRIVISEFGTRATPDPCQTIFQRFASLFQEEELTDNAMISLYPFRDQLYAYGELPTIHRIDKDTLESVCPVDVSKYVNIVHHTSHPHVIEDGTVFNLGLSVSSTGPKYAIMKFPHTKKDSPTTSDVFSEAEIVAKVKTRWSLHPGYMHTFGITENFFVVVEQPMSLSLPEKIKCQISGKAPFSALKFYEDYPTIFHVVSRKTGEPIASFTSEPFFYFHIINQYEEDDHVVIDICVYKDATMIDCLLIEALKEGKENPEYAKMFRGRPARFVLPLKPKENEEGNLVTLQGTETKAFRTKEGEIHVIPEILCQLGCELPRLNYPLHLGVKYRYFYGISSDSDLENPGSLVKVDTVEKSYKTWSSEMGIFPGEPVFIPNPNGKSEDDGVILSPLLWMSDVTKVGLVFIDGQSFEEIARTEFETNNTIPKCLHGWFVSS